MFQRGKLLWVCFGIIVFALLLTACAPKPTPTPTPKPTPTATPRPLATPTPTPQPTPTPIKGEGKLVAFMVGTYLASYDDPRFLPTFERETGCKTTVFGGITPAMLARVQAEKSSPTIDFYNMEYSPATQAKTLGLLDKVNKDIVTNLKAIPAKYVDPDGILMPQRLSANGLIINKAELEKKGLPKPTSWLDIGNPIYKGKVAISGIETATTWDMITLVARALGGSEKNPDVAFKFLEEKVKPNILGVVALADIEKMLGEGSILITYSALIRAARPALQGLPVEMIFPKDGFTMIIQSMEIVKGAANPVCANLFLNFILDKRVQEIVPELFLSIPVRPDATIPEKYKGIIPDPKFIAEQGGEVDFSVIDRSVWIDRWNRIFAK
ncbi:MAG: extracellular solute-binding protein [Chloroflexi bacterium]|nr:extracellular solute-binding protein [Chloroflexota bacterium]